MQVNLCHFSISFLHICGAEILLVENLLFYAEQYFLHRDKKAQDELG